ncbi:MAG: SphA family protein [Methyloligella sp. ZOD6]
MKWAAGVLVCALTVGIGSNPALAVEGPIAAGPIGGIDIHAGQLPPAGLYGGALGYFAGTTDFKGPDGETLPDFRDADLKRQYLAPYLMYVPDWKVLDGSVGIVGYLPMGNQCGHLFVGEAENCSTGFGDPYVELDWSRSFGHYRPSRDPEAYPIFEGLSVLFGFGVTFPVGSYDDDDRLEQVLSMSTNIWDFSPTVGITYATPPILLEGTEFSARFFWNNYLKNPSSRYTTGDLLNIDFAITERWGRYQFGLAGYYAWQVEDDRWDRFALPAHGWQVESLGIGPIVNYDMPEYDASLKVKSFFTVHERNAIEAWYVVFGWFQKF